MTMRAKDQAQDLPEWWGELDRRLAQVEWFGHGRVFAAQQVAVRETAALDYLNKTLSPQAWVPAAGGWACSYESLATMVDEILARGVPVNVVETGSGVSTVWLGLALRECGGKLVALEHDPVYAERTQRMLGRHNLEGVCQVVVAPLVDETGWYGIDGVDLMDSCDLMLVDGPPGASRRMAREPAFRRLGHLLVDGATIVVDDISRADESDMVQKWRGDAASELQHLGDFGDAGFYRYRLASKDKDQPN